jgi:hypothetical protein
LRKIFLFDFCVAELSACRVASIPDVLRRVPALWPGSPAEAKANNSSKKRRSKKKNGLNR